MSNTESTIPIKAAKTGQPVDEYANMVELLAIYFDADNQLKALENTVNEDYLECIDEHKSNYANLQKKLKDAESALEVIALKNPQWFAGAKSLKTPYGTLKFAKSSKLEIANEEVTILLIEKEGEKDKEFKADDFIHTKKVLNREALEKLGDLALAKLRIKRVVTESFSVAPAKIDMGKAVKEAAEKGAKK